MRSEGTLFDFSARLVGGVFGILIGTLIIAVIVRFVAGREAHFKLPFGMSYKATLAAFVLSGIPAGVFEVWRVMNGSADSYPLTAIPILFIAGFLIESAIYGRLIRYPKNGPIGIGKGLKINLIKYLFLLGILVISTATLLWYSPLHKPAVENLEYTVPSVAVTITTKDADGLTEKDLDDLQLKKLQKWVLTTANVPAGGSSKRYGVSPSVDSAFIKFHGRKLAVVRIDEGGLGPPYSNDRDQRA